MSRPAALALILVAAGARAQTVGVGGVVQPEADWQQQDTSVKVIDPRYSGFAIRRTRSWLFGDIAWNKVRFEARIEAELMPQFQLLDAYVAASSDLAGGGRWRIGLGQQFAPFSRQTMMPAAEFQMIEPAQLTSLTPNRQIGISALLSVPYAPWIEISGGVFDGKGVDIIENIDNNLMYVGRLAFRPIGPRGRITESALGEDQLSIAGDVSYNVKNLGDYDETTLLVGADAFFCKWGLSAYSEFLYGHVTYPASSPKQNYDLRGINAQAGYLLPIPGVLYRRLEVAARYEEIQPNTTIQIEGPGDPNQHRGSIVGEINYYHRGHSLKVQLAWSHNIEFQKVDRNGNNAEYANDTLVLMVTGRLEFIR